MYYDFAIAEIYGDSSQPDMIGHITFRKVYGGVIVCVDIFGLSNPKQSDGNKELITSFGFHIHEEKNCNISDIKNHLRYNKEHYNPNNLSDNNKSEDFPILIATNGYIKTCFFTDKFNIDEIIGKTAIIHQNTQNCKAELSRDDVKMIGCGTIRKTYLDIDRCW